MKRLFTFPNASKKPDQPSVSPSTGLSITPSSDPSKPQNTSPTTSRRPTARNASEPWQSMDVIATPEALLIRPRQDAAAVHLNLSWGKTVSVTELKGARDELDWELSALPIYGIVGIVTLFSNSYLLVINEKSSLGSLCSPSRPVFGIKSVVYIPLEYQAAKVALERLVFRLRKPSSVPPVSLANEPLDTDSLHVKWAPQHLPTTTPDATSVLSASPTSSGYSTPQAAGVSIAPLAKTLADKLSFWKSRRGSDANEASLIASKTHSVDHETLGEMVDDIDSGDTTTIEPTQAIDDLVSAVAPEPVSSEARYLAVEVKVVKEIIRQFMKGGMYFAYSFDLSNSLQRKQQQVERLKKQEHILADLNALGDWEKLEPCEDAQPFREPLAKLPLWQRIDRRFWWNEHLIQPLIEAELHGYILPIIQGYFQLSTFEIPLSTDLDTPGPKQSHLSGLNRSTIPVDYIVISRRSRDRAGLRYQRRGIDDDAHVANFVETEAILRLQREETENVFSFVQIRGSIPLYWTQTGYGLKPPPQLDPTRTNAQNLSAMTAHLRASIQRYGPQTCVNLAEQHGREGEITGAYRDVMTEASLPDAKYHEFDFHVECRGMHYENISKLTHQLERTFEKQGFYWISGSTVMSQQRGVFRVNCIDCLDRTNVVQSAFARQVLDTQLETLALVGHPNGVTTQADAVFNDAWANNGDTISRAYAGTSALKGDYTRTGRRDLSGMLNDGINSLARVYTSTFSDWFSQSVIDYFLGFRGTSVFTEFLQNLSSQDTRDVVRLSKIREAAIEQASSIVVVGTERVVASWTLLSPVDFNVRLADYFEEKILLLTQKAIYIVSYDYSLEKVVSSTRVALGDIVGIQKGPYIISALNTQTKDPLVNYGFQVSFLTSRADNRATTYSIRNTPGQTDVSVMSKRGYGATISRMLSNQSSRDQVTNIAFKSLPVDPKDSTPKDTVDQLVTLLLQSCSEYGAVDEDFLVEQDIVSVTEAQRSTTLFSRFEYNFKRLLWLGG